MIALCLFLLASGTHAAISAATVDRCTVFLTFPDSSSSSHFRQAECNVLAARASSVYFGEEAAGAFHCGYGSEGRLFTIFATIRCVSVLLHCPCIQS